MTDIAAVGPGVDLVEWSFAKLVTWLQVNELQIYVSWGPMGCNVRLVRSQVSPLGGDEVSAFSTTFPAALGDAMDEWNER